MTARLLPREEWHRLSGTDVEPALAHLPELAQIVVVEDGAGIAFSWIAVPVWHLEGLTNRGGFASLSMGKRFMFRLLRALGIHTVMTHALSDDVRLLLRRVHATPVPGEAYVLSVGGA